MLSISGQTTSEPILSRSQLRENNQLSPMKLSEDLQVSVQNTTKIKLDPSTAKKL